MAERSFMEGAPRKAALSQAAGTPGQHVAAGSIAIPWLGGVGRRAFLAALPAIACATVPRSLRAEHPGTFEQADGLAIFFVVVPAAFALVHPPQHTGRGMHGDVPEGRYVHHLLVAVFDSATGMRITNAKVTAVVQGGLQPSATRIELEAMVVGGGQAYGGFASLPPRDRYRIEIEVARPGVAPVRAVFSHQHLQP